MKNTNYIPAFTIIEVIVSMVVTAVILSIIFVIFSITSQRLTDFKLQNEGIADLNRLTYGINKCIFESEEMFYEDNNLKFINTNGQYTRYTIESNYFLMVKDDFTDTLDISISKMRIDTINNSSKTEIYQRLNLNIICNSQAVNLNFYKKVYSAALLKNMIRK